METMDSRERSFLDQMQSLHASGGDLNAPVLVDVLHSYQERLTPLRHVVRQGWCSALDWLTHRADVNGRDGDWTPLCIAASYDRRDAAVLLLDAGARFGDRSGRTGRTALHFAAMLAKTKMCKLLSSRGASLGALDNDGNTPEALARRHSHTAIADFLAEIRAAGGWAKYVAAPRAELLALRHELPSLRERGRASPSTVRAHERLFLNTTLPDDVLCHILAYWRTARDCSR